MALPEMARIVVKQPEFFIGGPIYALSRNI